MIADQFGEGDDWRLLSPDDPRRFAYVFDWDDCDTDPTLPAWDHGDHIRRKDDGRLLCEMGCRAHQTGTT